VDDQPAQASELESLRRERAALEREVERLRAELAAAGRRAARRDEARAAEDLGHAGRLAASEARTTAAEVDARAAWARAAELGTSLGRRIAEGQARLIASQAAVASLERANESLAVGQAAVALREADLRAVIESAIDCAIVTTDRDGLVLAWNSGARRLLGWDEASATAMSFDAVLPPEECGALAADAEAALSGTRVSREGRLLRQDGTAVWAGIEAMALRADGADEPVGVLWMLRDRTASQLAEESLRASEARLETLLELLPFGVGEFDAEGRFVVANPALRRLVGEMLPSREVQPRWRGFDDTGRQAPPHDFPAARALRGEAVPVDMDFVTEVEGERRWFQVGAVPLRRDGAVTGGICVAVDVTERSRAEAALRESEAKLRLVVDNLPVQVGFYDSDLRYAYVNEEGARFFGVPREAMLGQKLSEFLKPHVFARLRPRLEAALRGERQHFEDMEPDKFGPGQHGWTEETYVPRRAPDGRVEGFVALVVDITGRKRGERALRESEARHRLLIESLAQALWETDADGGVVTDSPSWRAYTGQTPDEWLGYGWLDAIHPDDRAYAGRQWREAVAARALVDAEFRLRAPDGGWRWTNVRAAPVLDATGQVEKWVGMNIDIDARKAAEAALRESEARYRTLFEAMDEAYAVVEVLRDEAGAWHDFRFVEVNPAFIKHTGMPWPVGRTAIELLGTPNPRWARMYGQALDTGEPLRVQESEPTLGRVFDLNIFSLDRERNRVAVLFTDITARVRAEEALRQSEEKLRSLFDAIDEGLAIVEMIYDDRGEITDMIYRQVNAAYERQGGVRDVIGRSIFEVLPGVEEVWLDRYRQVARTGEPIRVEDYQRDVGRWFEVYFSRVDAQGRFVAIVFNDITDRKRAEAELRASAERQAFLLKLSDTLRGENDERRIERVALELLAEQLSVDRAYITTSDYGKGETVVSAEVRRDELPALVGTFRHSDFPESARLVNEGTLVIGDVATDAHLSEPNRRSIEAVRIGALIAVGLRKGVSDIFWTLAVATEGPRRWTPAEVALVEEAAERSWAAMERARQEAALRESDEKYRTMADYAPALIWETDESGARFVNRPYLDFFGVSAGDIEGMGWAHFLHPDDAQSYLDAYREAFQKRQSYSYECRFRRADGQYRWLRSSGGPAGARRYIGCSVDVTDTVIAEQALRESEERFRSFAENSADVLWITNRDGSRLDYLSPAFERTFGEPRDRILADLGRFRELLHPDDRDAVAGFLPRTLAGETVVGHYRVVRPSDGRVVHLRDTGFPIRDASGAVVRAAGIVQDVTDIREAGARLRESEARLRAIMDTAPQIAWTATTEGHHDYYNQRWYEYTGLTHEQTEADGWKLIVHPDDLTRTQERLRHSMRTGEDYEVEYRFRRADGVYRWFMGRGVPVRGAPDRDHPQGRILHWIGTCTDIEDLVRAREVLREGEALLRALVEGIPQPVWRAAPDGRWTWASGQWTALTGQPEHETLGHGWLAAVHPLDRAAVLAAWRGAEAGGAFRAEHRLWHAGEGRWRWAESQARPVHDGPDGGRPDNGGIVEWIGATTDVEELRRAQEQRILIEELHHRGRNLLAVVAGVAEQTLAASGSLQEFGDAFTHRLAALGRVQGLLSREVAPKVTLEELMRLELAAHGFDAGDDRVALRGPEVELPARVVQLLALALHELTTNALKHGALGRGGRLKVTWAVNGSPELGELRIDWAESGVGVPPRGGPDARRGFGLDLLEQLLPYELDGETRVEFTPSGLRCSVRLPLDGGGSEGA
jgi:PAS domain S-box-containing protein